MNQAASTPAPEGTQPAGLSHGSRIVNIFLEPSATFADLKRSTSWWPAFLFMMVVGYLMVFAVQQKVGWERVSQNEMQARMSGSAAERFESMTPEQRAQQMSISVTITRVMSLAWPIMALISMVVIAAVLMATFNFGLGAQIPFKMAFAVVVFSFLISSVRSLLAAASLFVGNPEDFYFSNPVGTNLGFFIDSKESPVLHAFGTYVDVISIWMLIVMGIGFATVSKVKKGSAWSVVFGWYALIALAVTGIALVTS